MEDLVARHFSLTLFGQPTGLLYFGQQLPTVLVGSLEPLGLRNYNKQPDFRDLTHLGGWALRPLPITFPYSFIF